MRKLRRLLLTLSAFSVACSYAQPAPKITSLSREWIQRGTTAELTVNGENLSGAKEVIISGAPGLKGTVVPPEGVNVQVESSASGISSVAPSESKKLKINLEIGETAALTAREVRLVTAHGVSNPVTLRVGHLPEADAANNQSRDKAQAIALPVTISGTINNAAESHFYRFGWKKGEHVILEVNAYRLGSKLDSSLAVLSPDGKELARSEDAAGLDSVIDFAVPEDGEYVVELRDFRYQGGGDFKYRLSVGAFPHVVRSFPFGAQRGAEVNVQLVGANLDGTSKVLLNIAPDASLGRQEIRASTGRGLSNPFPLEVSDLPSFAETEPNTAIDQADLITVPVAVNGRVNKQGDYDAFKFRATKDQRIVFEVNAFSFGSPLDAVLILSDASGNELQRNDDAAASDARIDYTFKEAGEYCVFIEDLLSRGGDDYGYRLTAAAPQPDFSAVVTVDTPRIRRGGRVPIRCEVYRVNGFNETVKIFCEELPAGIFAEPLLLPSEAGSGFLMLSAVADSPLGSFPLRVFASAEEKRKTATFLLGDKPVKAGFLSVIEGAPFSIASATLMSTIEQSQSGRIDVVVERRNGFVGEIKITPEGFSTGREPITRSFEFQPLTIRANENRGTLSLRAKTDSEIVSRNVILRGESDVNGQTIVTFSPLIPMATGPIPFVLSTSLKKLVVTALPSGSESAASEAVFALKADRRMNFTGEILVKIDGLPEGVSARVPNIATNANEATIRLVASDKAATGKDANLTITGTGAHNDRNYRFSAPPVTLSINAPDPEEKKEPKLANTAE